MSVRTGFWFRSRGRKKRCRTQAASKPPKRPPRPIDTAAGKTSRHRGVCYIKSSGKWQAQISVDGKTRYLGNFADEEAAAAAFFGACHEIRRDLTPPKKSSQYRGVKMIDQDRWVANISLATQDYYLGTFTTEVEAAHEYDAVARAKGVGERANFPLPA